jgi:hypothetical protein
VRQANSESDRVKLIAARLVFALVTAASIASAHAQSQGCRIEPFQGASLPGGAVLKMTVTNTGAACTVANYGVPGEKKNPADSGSVTSQPSHGTAEFVAPQARYTPAPGYAGDDEFTYEAFARGANNQPLRLTVQVKVAVRAP